MKQIKLLALLAVLVFAGTELKDLCTGFRDGYYADDEKFNFNLKVEPAENCVPDTAYFAAAGKQLPYISRSISVADTHCWEPGIGIKIMTIVVLPFALLAIYGFYCFVRMLLSVLRGEVFTRRNVRRLRFFAYGFMSAAFVLELQQWLLFREMASFAPEGYLSVYPGLEFSWILIVLMALLTEIFAVGVKIKEEQDLTI